MENSNYGAGAGGSYGADADSARIIELLEEIEENTRKQRRYSLIFGCIRAVCAVIIMVLLYISLTTLVPKVAGTLDNLETTTNSITSLANSTDTLLNENAEAMTQVMNGMSSIDFESLNNSIRDLANIIAPLANLFGGSSSASGAGSAAGSGM